MMNYSTRAKRYAKRVVDEKIVTSRYVKLACKRFLNDLANKDLDYKFDERYANHICAFMENGINHIKGPLAGKLLKIEDWQIFYLSNIYGWRLKSNEKIKRFQYVILEVARKNGKSLFASGLAIYEMLFGEEGGEVYSLATKQDQAKIAWEAAVQMINKSVSEVKEQFKIVTNKISNQNKWTTYTPLGRDSKSLDGLNPSFCIFDEAAAYSDRNLVEVMTSATGARDNFTHLFITTAQFSRTTVYFENRLYLIDILEGRITDDKWFGMLYCLDEEEEWLDESNWIKANPNLDVSIKKEFLRDEVNQARTMKSKRNGVLVKHFNVFTNAEESWINLPEWQKNSGAILKEGDFYIACDLSSTRDLTALCYLWNNGDKFSVDFQCFLPRKSMELVPIHIRPKYEEAVKSGILILTSGDVVDYREVISHIADMNSKYKAKMIGYDKWNASILVNELEDKRLPVMDIGQNMASLSAASKETERLIVEELIRQEGNPFIDWQLECCSVYTDKNENIKITKDDADKSLKIDAIVAMIMAISMAAGQLEKPKEFNFRFIEFN